MWVNVSRKKSTEIDTQSVKDILSMYSEEQLSSRPIFEEAFNNDLIEFRDLKEESEKIIIPWQMFFLNPHNLKKEIEHIETMRIDKVSAKLIAKRRGSGKITSKRIIDRLIRLQNYVCNNPQIPNNPFCRSLIGKSESDAVAHILFYFDIDINRFRTYKNKSGSLDYLIKQVQARGINISQGVLTNKMLPNHRVVDNSVYKNTSGFVIRDDKIPFVFLPSEVNPNETDGRQIYTLIYLIVLIGLDAYNFYIERDFTTKAIKAIGKLAKLYGITSELLLPKDITEELRGEEITLEIRDALSSKYKITPTAVLVTLRIRKIISKEEYEALLPPQYIPPKIREHRYSPVIETSVRKFCGKYPFEYINSAIKGGTIKNIQAQYLLFGSVNKKGYKSYRSRLKI